MTASKLGIWSSQISSVRSSCINEAMNWSPPFNRGEIELHESFKSVPAVFAKLSWRFSITQRLLCPCWNPKIFHWFVNVLSRYDLLGSLVTVKTAICLQHSGLAAFVLKIPMVILTTLSTVDCCVVYTIHLLASHVLSGTTQCKYFFKKLEGFNPILYKSTKLMVFIVLEIWQNFFKHAHVGWL